MQGTSYRLAAIDALRGFALFGIVVVNQAAFHSGIAGVTLGGVGTAAWRSSLVDAVILWLFAGKFILIFSFLFGWGIHTQAARGGNFRARYLRRLAGLALIGLAHGAFLFFGDILVAYAILGLFMLRPVRHDWPVRRLVRSALVLLCVYAVLVLAAAAPVLVGPSPDPAFEAYLARSAELYRTGSFWEVVPHRLGDFAIALASALVAQGWALLAMFRLGFAAAKACAESGLEAVRALARRILWVALIPALAVNAACAAGTLVFTEPWASSALMVPLALFMPPVALAYLAAAALILTGRAGGRVNAALGAGGRMSLTVYVGQSVVLSLLFHGYGLGLAEAVGSAGGVLVAAAVYAVLAGASLLWLGLFRIGPLEWVLRSITEWRPVALRPARPAGAAAATGPSALDGP